MFISAVKSLWLDSHLEPASSSHSRKTAFGILEVSFRSLLDSIVMSSKLWSSPWFAHSFSAVWSLLTYSTGHNFLLEYMMRSTQACFFGPVQTGTGIFGSNALAAHCICPSGQSLACCTVPLFLLVHWSQIVVVLFFCFFSREWQ